MNKLLLVAGIVFLGFTGAVRAQCSCSGNEQVKGTDLTTALQGNTVCVPNGAAWEWQEQHRAGGQLWDYKRGAGHPVDPTEQVGTWAVSGSGATTIVTHAYGSQSFAYRVCRAGTTSSYGFCPSSGATIMATIKAGTASGCP